jgi:hypothetical protein
LCWRWISRLAGGGCLAAVVVPRPHLSMAVLEARRLLPQKPPTQHESRISQSAIRLLRDPHPFSLLHRQLLCHHTSVSQTTRACFPTRTRTIARCPRRYRLLRVSAWRCFDLAFSALFVIWCCIRYPIPFQLLSRRVSIPSIKSSLPKFAFPTMK